MNEASIDELKRDIIFRDDSELPVLCISLFDNQMIFTTKKIGSRYFEDITKPNSSKDNPNTIEFKIIRYSNSQQTDPDYDSRLIFDNYYFVKGGCRKIKFNSNFRKYLKLFIKS